MNTQLKQIITLSFVSLISFSVNSQTADLVWEQYVEQGAVDSNLPDFSYAGFYTKATFYEQFELATFNVTSFGAIPNDNMDDSLAIQQAINAASGNGGGIVFLPKGQYRLRGGDTDHVLRVSASNVIIRGERVSDENATVLLLENPSESEEFGLIGQNSSDLRSIAAISIQGEPNDTVLANFAEQDLSRGTRIVPVNNTDELFPHQTIRIRLTDPRVNVDVPDRETGDLIKSLIKPFNFEGQETRTFGRYGKTVEYIARVRRVIDDKHVELYQPLRFDHLEKYSSVIMAFGGLKNVGVEHIRIESSWQGQYRHHLPYPENASDAEVIRSEREQDYGWVAIWGTWISNSWFDNLSIDNFTQNLILSNSAYIDVSKIALNGNGGHAGLSYSSAHSILTRDIHFSGRYVHPLSVRAWTSGCVFTNITTESDFYNPIDRTGPFIDFHGLYPYENLFENIIGFYVQSSGDQNVLPHSGIRNTFWNIQTPERIERFPYAIGEFFNTTATKANQMHEHHPSSIIVGVFGENGGEVLINGSPMDRVDAFLQVYNLNKREVPVNSLFNAQVALRESRFPLAPVAPLLLNE